MWELWLSTSLAMVASPFEEVDVSTPMYEAIPTILGTDILLVYVVPVHVEFRKLSIYDHDRLVFVVVWSMCLPVCYCVLRAVLRAVLRSNRWGADVKWMFAYVDEMGYHACESSLCAQTKVNAYNLATAYTRAVMIFPS